MLVKCICGKEEIGRIHNLNKRWAILFVQKGIRIERCEKCKPLFWTLRQRFKIFNIDINKEIKEKINKLNIINQL